MKRIINILMLSFFLMMGGYSQNSYNALFYSIDGIPGTARSISMAGAFGSLGGDFSSLSVNPAGIGIYRSSELTFTPAITYNNVESSFYGNKRNDYKYNFNLNNFGYVGSVNANSNTGWVNFNFGIGFNRLNSYHTNQIIGADRLNTSMVDYFTGYANGRIPDHLDNYYERIIHDVSILEFVYDSTVSEDKDKYKYITPIGEFVNQKRSIETKGAKNEWVLSYGANFGNQFYFGATLGLKTIRRTSTLRHTETNAVDGLKSGFSSFTYKEEVYTHGAGVNFKIGAIAKPILGLRLGLAFHLPTAYYLTDELSTSAESDIAGIIRTARPNGKSISEYKLVSPSKLVGSIAYVFGKYGLLSVDVERVDYSKAKLRPDDTDNNYDEENDAIAATYKESFNYKLGAEIKMGMFALRGGFSFHESPYTSENLNKDYYKKTYALGLGYREQNFFVDLGYSLTDYKYFLKPYNNDYVEYAKQVHEYHKILVTVGFRF